MFNKVCVTFEVEFIQVVEDEVPRLVGSLPELGSWNNARGINAEKTNRQFIWSVTVNIPENSFFFFLWISTVDDKVVQDELISTKNVTIGIHGGTVQSIFGESAILDFIPHNSCRVRLRTRYNINRDELLGIVGLYGNWRREDVLLAVNHISHWNFSFTFDVQQGSYVEFKMVVLDKEKKYIKRWQVGDNRRIDIKPEVTEYNAIIPWDGYMKQVSDFTFNAFSTKSSTTVKPARCPSYM